MSATLKRTAGEAAHKAVMAFDHKPDEANTAAAIDALNHYLGVLVNTRTPKTREEMAAFATAWDAKVDADRSKP